LIIRTFQCTAAGMYCVPSTEQCQPILALAASISDVSRTTFNDIGIRLFQLYLDAVVTGRRGETIVSPV